ncbi:M50 family metallopeptidase [Spirosoma fluviale]|uniref:Peptidase M50B-like n=1 Tax=Spirosoma fluviale TaxID=1597977 RepID=A0A286GLP8_9BACT|nr:M50 family metallopeptidase [Spirosoma fluviale]SOD96457.1 Peptidase M50B-like [Spirosoma fluviale]
MFRKMVFLLPAVFLAWRCALQLWAHSQYVVSHASRYSGLLVGACAFAALWAMRNRWSLVQNWLTYFGTKVHEGAHEKMAFLSGRRLFGYNIQQDGTGYIIYENTGASPLITLAPYFFSYTSLGLLALRWLMLSEGRVYVDGLIGFLLAFHTYAFLTQTRYYQTDLQKMGLAYSTVFIPTMHLITYGLYAWVIGGLPILSYFKLF